MSTECERLEANRQSAWDRREDPSGTLLGSDHLADCPDCRARVEGARRLATALAVLPAIDLPPGFADRTLDRWSRERRRPVRRWVAVAAGLGAVGFVGFLIRPRPELAPIARVAPAPPTSTVPLPELATAASDLARSTSGPAARVGRKLWEGAGLANAGGSTNPSGPADPRRWLDRVGADVGRGVRPISGEIREAFAFLVPPGRGG